MVQDYFDEDGMLDKLFLIKNNYLSRIVIEYLGTDELIKLINTFNLNIKDMNIYYYFNKDDIKKKCDLDYKSFTDCYNEIYFYNILFEIKESNFYIWQPEGGEFFVLFGNLQFINKIDPKIVSKESFMEVLDDDTGLSEQGRKYMLDAFAKYSGLNEKEKFKS
ncbi:hypothetical protein [Commensalibacter oyaizuii]|uniref:Uncharacterized protein n=1 Tax=Commensalibacter oyaizuii TaxID=3043873 RepID=A0ABT6Q2U3_9PROT|nr:hypothetical protein [Commensalibacter sp. TBRC 16381]MDI2091308.1 hypothetical protein [Commensalibacter sp. TBRC 16381]